MRPRSDIEYYMERAREETRKVKAAINRGEHPAAVQAHGELAARYQARAFVHAQMD